MFRFPTLPALAALLALGTMPALAAGDGGSSNEPAPTLKCKKGEVVKNVTEKGVKKKKCVKAQGGILPDEELYQQGRFLAASGQYDWAIEVLNTISNQNDPRVLNYIGYSHRKAGRLDIGIGYYQKALAIDPNYVRAREYLGEGYAAAGKIGLAKVQLAEIANRCGETCEEYLDLSEAIHTATN
jgi:tetratricopeptide (TPR) repeat protein